MVLYNRLSLTDEDVKELAKIQKIAEDLLNESATYNESDACDEGSEIYRIASRLLNSKKDLDKFCLTDLD